MSETRENARRLREIVGATTTSAFDTFVAKVTAVDGATCSVSRVFDGKKFDRVRLNVNSKNSEGFVITPKVDSNVLITTIDGYEWFVSQFSEIEKVEFSDVHGFECVIENGVITSLKNRNYTLREAFDDLIAAIGRLTVTTGVGPSGIPINKAEFDIIKTKLDNFLK